MSAFHCSLPRGSVSQARHLTEAVLLVVVILIHWIGLDAVVLEQ